MDIYFKRVWTSLRKGFQDQNIGITHPYVLDYLIKIAHAQTGSMH